MSSPDPTPTSDPRAVPLRPVRLGRALGTGALGGVLAGVLLPALIYLVPSWGDTVQGRGDFAAPHTLGVFAFVVSLIATIPCCALLGLYAVQTWWWIRYRPGGGRTGLLLSTIGLVAVPGGFAALVTALLLLSPLR